MSGIDYLSIYKPKNKLYVRCEPIEQVYTTGSISTKYDGYMPNVSGNISSESKCKGYIVTITYDGSVNIGDRTIRTQRIPNYGDNAQVHAATEAATGISRSKRGEPYGSTCIQITDVFFVIIYCLWPFYACCYRNRKMNAREAKYDAAYLKIACSYTARDIANLLKEADESVTARIEEVEKQAALSQKSDSAGERSSGDGMITISAAQLMAAAAAQLQNLQPANMPVVVASSAAAEQNPVITPQYQQLTRAVAVDVELATRPATNDAPAVPDRKAKLSIS